MGCLRAGDLTFGLGKLLRVSKYEEEISDGHLGINEKELNSMNKHIPALKGFNPKSATFRQHYYPEGGWGWVVTFCATIVQVCQVSSANK